MDLSRLMVHVQQVEDSRRERGIHDVRRPRPQDQAGSSHGGHRINFGIHEHPRFKKGKQSFGINILRGVLHLKEADLSPSRAMEVRCIFLRKIVRRVAELIVESAYKA